MHRVEDYVKLQAIYSLVLELSDVDNHVVKIYISLFKKEKTKIIIAMCI